MRRHIITGGAGFVARYLIEVLAPLGEEIVLFDQLPIDNLPQGVRAITGNICSREDVEKIGLLPEDIVYHLAARQFMTRIPYFGRTAWFSEVNVAGTDVVLKAMEKHGTTKLVFFSTDMTYGLHQTSFTPPDHPQVPLGPYGKSKVQAEALMRSAQAKGLSATVFRPRLIAGRGRLGILTKLFELIYHNLPVPMIGSGDNRYQMVSVRDCAKAAVKAMEMQCPSGFFNLGSTNPPKSRDLLKALIAHAGSHSILIPTPATPVKWVLSGLDTLGLTLMYPEQYIIADKDITLDTSYTTKTFGWSPAETDISILIDAYDGYVSGKG